MPGRHLLDRLVVALTAAAFAAAAVAAGNTTPVTRGGCPANALKYVGCSPYGVSL